MSDQEIEKAIQAAGADKAPRITPDDIPAAQDDDNDFPLGNACDMSGEGTCEACQ